jgi:hypothetical protein
MGNTLNFLFEYNEYIKDIENSNKDEYIYNEILKRTKFNRLVILEGLIKTHPVDSSINILKRKFSELLISKEPDGEIYIENQPPKELKKYLPLITNLGYSISKFTIDGQEWLKDYDNDTKPIAFVIEAKYDYEVEIPKILYHTSPIRFKDKILKYGLVPKTSNKLSKHPERVYLTDSLDKSIMFGEYLKNDNTNEYYKSGYCIYQINGESLSKLYSDVNLREGGFYTTDNISTNNLKLIKEFIETSHHHGSGGNF